MSNNNALRDACFGELTLSLKALASEPSEQLALFPESQNKADDLAARFDDSARAVQDEYAPDLSRTQVDALAAVSRRLATMSRDGAEFDPELWTDAAVRTSPHWRDVRALARAALDAFEGSI